MLAAACLPPHAGLGSGGSSLGGLHDTKADVRSSSYETGDLAAAPAAARRPTSSASAHEASRLRLQHGIKADVRLSECQM